MCFRTYNGLSDTILGSGSPNDCKMFGALLLPLSWPTATIWSCRLAAASVFPYSCLLSVSRKNSALLDKLVHVQADQQRLLGLQIVPMMRFTVVMEFTNWNNLFFEREKRKPDRWLTLYSFYRGFFFLFLLKNQTHTYLCACMHTCAHNKT